MKQIFLTLLTFFSSMSLIAQDHVQIADFSIGNGEEKTLSIELNNSRQYTAFQMDVLLPEGLEFVTTVDETGKEVPCIYLDDNRKEATHTFSCNTMAERAMRFVAFSSASAPLKGNSGALVHMKVRASYGMPVGTHTITITGIRFVNNTEGNVTEYSFDDYTKEFDVFYVTPPTYTVTVLPSSNGTIDGGGEALHGQEITLTAIPDEGYEFIQWTDGTTANPYTFQVTENKEIGAVFSPKNYQITFVIDGETIETKTVAYGSVIVPADAPMKEGYTFAGWGDIPATMPAHDLTVEGSYTVNTYTITYYVDGEAYRTESVAYGEVIVLIDEPTKEGYLFSGWSEVPATMPANDIRVDGAFVVDGIDNLVDANTTVMVYNINGVLIKKNVKYQDALRVLSKGMYIINGKKILVK